jgi:hypothetical protein
MDDTRRNLLRFEVPLGALGASLVALAFVFAHSGIPQWIPSAPITRIGVASPLTGMTRSFVALARGDAGDAFAWHPLGPACFVACLAAAVYALVAWTRRARSNVLTRVFGTRLFGYSVSVAFALA